MTQPPVILGHGAEQMRFIAYAVLRPEQRQMADASLAGPGSREMCGKAVCEIDGGFFLFSCDADWQVMFDDWFPSLQSAERQAEFDCPGIATQWVRVDSEIRKGRSKRRSA
ncbi:MAG TPA: hypothetical protein VGR35_13605 [Tepidisphaeraceae bacterium]|nr:hypothetical protein [Tepidisphaeraceae bacterium]